MEVPDNVEQTLDHLPDEPGVYLLKDGAGEILYVGKAKSLRDRVPHYFRNSVSNPKTRQLATRVQDVETIVVESESQALEVEYDLIKEHRPRYNISYRDNKRYPYIKVTMDEPYPRVLTTRQKDHDGSKYFGPYTDVGSMRKTLSTLREIFPYRSCNDDIPAGGDEEKLSVCLDYHIKQCEGPCEGLQSMDDYREMIGNLCEFLRGNYKPVRNYLKQRMTAHAEDHEYEAAAVYRDRLDALEKTVEHQAFVESTRNADVLGVGEAEQVSVVVLISIREHRVINRREFTLDRESLSPQQTLQDFLMTYYRARTQLPQQVLVEQPLPDQELVGEKLSERAGRRLEVDVPQKGEKKRLIDMASRTARLNATDESISLRRREGDVLSVIKELFDLDSLPRVIEGFDVSTHQGKQTVASMVRFVDGEPEKQDYRRFKIRDVDGVDDYGALREVVRRRYRRLLEEDRPLPDVVFVDGGRGQLTTAKDVLSELEVHRPVISLAKQQELLFVEERQAPYDLPDDSTVLQLFQRIRDEAHRFAITYHRDRRRGMVSSRLKEIRGIGDSRLQNLIERFGSPTRVRQASVEELTEVAGITEEIARNIKQLAPPEPQKSRFD